MSEEKLQQHAQLSYSITTHQKLTTDTNQTELVPEISFKICMHTVHSVKKKFQ